MKKMEFSKKIVVWDMWLTTIYIVFYCICKILLEKDLPAELTDLIKVIAIGVIISYCAKAGFENGKKLKNISYDNPIEPMGGN